MEDAAARVAEEVATAEDKTEEAPQPGEGPGEHKVATGDEDHVLNQNEPAIHLYITSSKIYCLCLYHTHPPTNKNSYQNNRPAQQKSSTSETNIH